MEEREGRESELTDGRHGLFPARLICGVAPGEKTDRSPTLNNASSISFFGLPFAASLA